MLSVRPSYSIRGVHRPPLAALKLNKCTQIRSRLITATQATQQPTLQGQGAQHKAFEILKAALPVCSAALSTSSTGLRGLTASRHLEPGDIALLVPHHHSLSVPTGGAGSVARWENTFLEPWQAVHGNLPPALTQFLADTRQDPTIRISAWLLYLRQHCTSRSSNHSWSSCRFWRAWLEVLPRADEATNANGFWTPAELQQLQLEPYKGVMESVNTLTARMCAQAHQQLCSGDLGQLHLASNVEDVMWGVFATRTRASSHGDAVTLRPVHDMMNHAAVPNATCSLTDAGYAVEALTPIPAGREITISYTGEEPDAPEGLATPSLELLMTWGFTLGPSTQDLILPMQYQALPHLSWETVLAAGAAAVEEATQQATMASLASRDAQESRLQDLPESGTNSTAGSQQELLTLLQAVVSNLPVATGAAGSSSGRGDGNGGGGGSSVTSALYRRGADALSSFGFSGTWFANSSVTDSNRNNRGMSSSIGLQLVGTTAGPLATATSSAVASTAQLLAAPVTKPIDLEEAVAHVPGWAVFERPYLTQLQLQELQADFASELRRRLSPIHRLNLTALGAASPAGPMAAVAAAAAAAALLPLSVIHQGLYSSSGGSGNLQQQDSYGGAQQVRMQLLVATALLCEAQCMMLQAGTTIQQDEAVLTFLEGQHSTPYSTQSRAQPRAQAQLRPPEALAMNPAPLPAATVMDPTADTAAVDASAKAASTGYMLSHLAAGAVAATFDTVQPQQLQQSAQFSQLDSFKARQLSILRWLLLMNAEEALRGSTPQPADFLTAAGTAGMQRWQQAAARLPWAAGSAAAAAALPDMMQQASSSSMPPSMAAPLKVITALLGISRPAGTVKESVVFSSLSHGFNSGSDTWQQVTAALALQEQQIRAWQSQQKHQFSTTARAAVAEASALLASGQASKARLMTAVAARLQHKKLLQAYISLLQHAQKQLKLAYSKASQT